MSHRVTTKTEMKDLALVQEAAKAAGVTCTANGDIVTFTGGALRGAILDLKTGNITGDSDYGHTSDVLGALRQGYAEAGIRAHYLKNGGYVESRQVVGEDVVLICSIG